MESRPAVRAFDDGVDRWEMTDARPAPALQDRISHYTDYREETRSFSARREIAAVSGVLIYALAEPLEIIGADGRGFIVRAGEAFAGGISDASSTSRNLGAQAGIHVFMPLCSLAAALGTPLAEVANCVAPLRDLIGADADDLGGRLCEANSADRRFALLDAFFIRRFADAGDPDRPVEHAMRRLARPAAPAAAELASELGWSRRHLARRFRTVTGFSPDRFRRIARFQRFATALSQAPGDSLAGLAADHGYVDQAHLTREVRDFAGLTPGELRAQLVPGGAGFRAE